MIGTKLGHDDIKIYRADLKKKSEVKLSQAEKLFSLNEGSILSLQFNII